jgi:RHS repeat-associated protein
VEVFSYRGAEWHRFSQATAAGGEYFLYDGDNVVADIASGVDAFYVTPFLDQNLSVTTGGSTYYYTQDGLGSVRTLTDSTGTVKNTYDYLPFGGAYAPGTNVTVEQRYTYTGREKNPESALMYYRYRQYDPRVGRFSARDPLRYWARRGLYAYASSRVTRVRDPFGLIDTVGHHVARNHGKELKQKITMLAMNYCTRNDEDAQNAARAAINGLSGYSAAVGEIGKEVIAGTAEAAGGLAGEGISSAIDALNESQTYVDDGAGAALGETAGNLVSGAVSDTALPDNPGSALLEEFTDEALVPAAAPPSGGSLSANSTKGCCVANASVSWSGSGNVGTWSQFYVNVYCFCGEMKTEFAWADMAGTYNLDVSPFTTATSDADGDGHPCQ